MPLSPQREFIQTFPSPDERDVLFWELRDSKLPENSEFEYGVTEHPEKGLFPDHKLVYVEPHDEEGKQKWWFAKDRDEQEEYNWRVSYPFNGLTDFPTYECSFILPRSTYAAIEKGKAHPLDLGDDTPTKHERFKEAVLQFEQQIDLPGVLGAVYIAVRRVYAKVPPVAAQLVHEVEQTFPYAGRKEFPRIERTLIIPRQEWEPLAKGTVDQVFDAAELIEEAQLNINDETLEALYILVRRVYDEVPSLTAQEDFNAEYTYPYHGSEDFPRITRSYVVKRSEYAALAQSTVDNVFTEAALVGQKADRFSDSRDSLYLLLTRIFDQIPDISDVDDATFLHSVGYRITRPYGDKDFPRLTWRFPIEKAFFSLTAKYTACPIPGYESLKLTDEQLEDDNESPDRGFVTRVYDTLPGPELISTEVTRDYGIPRKFIKKQEVTQTNQSVEDSEAVGSTGGDPTDGSGATVKSQIGPNGQSIIVLEKGDTLLKLEVEAVEGWTFDPATGRVFKETQEVVAAGTPGVDIDAAGYFSEVSPVSPYFSIKTTKKSTGLTDEVTYDTIENYSWPAVLQTLQFSEVIRKGDSGEYTERYQYHYRLKPAYSGPCKAHITEGWSKTKPSVVLNAAMIPEAIRWDLILLRGSIPACLHPAITLYETTGTSHPIYPYTVGQVDIPATNYIDWPSTIVAAHRVWIADGGFRYRKVLIDAPSD